MCLYPILNYGHWCSTDTLITVPMNFWCNSDLFKQNSFLAQKLTNLEHFKGNLLNFPKKICQIQNMNHWNVFEVSMINLSIKSEKDLDPVGSEITIFLFSHTYAPELPPPSYPIPCLWSNPLTRRFLYFSWGLSNL